jgi:hypothetical protein
MQNDQHCNNCGKKGHIYNQCKMPITSIGIIVFRKHNERIEYLMIRRRDTLGYIDFMRGKYSVNNRDYIMNMLNYHSMNYGAIYGVIKLFQVNIKRKNRVLVKNSIYYVVDQLTKPIRFYKQ